MENNVKNAFKVTVKQKANWIKRGGTIEHLKKLADELGITEKEDYLLLGGVDAMVYDMAHATGFSKGEYDFSKTDFRKEVIQELWKDWKK